MVITDFPLSPYNKLRREIKYMIGNTLFVFRVFEDRLEKLIYEKNKKPLVFQMRNESSSWVRIYTSV